MPSVYHHPPTSIILINHDAREAVISLHTDGERRISVSNRAHLFFLPPSSHLAYLLFMVPVDIFSSPSLSLYRYRPFLSFRQSEENAEWPSARDEAILVVRRVDARSPLDGEARSRVC